MHPLHFSQRSQASCSLRRWPAKMSTISSSSWLIRTPRPTRVASLQHPCLGTSRLPCWLPEIFRFFRQISWKDDKIWMLCTMELCTMLCTMFHLFLLMCWGWSWKDRAISQILLRSIWGVKSSDGHLGYDLQFVPIGNVIYPLVN